MFASVVVILPLPSVAAVECNVLSAMSSCSRTIIAAFAVTECDSGCVNCFNMQTAGLRFIGESYRCLTPKAGRAIRDEQQQFT